MRLLTVDWLWSLWIVPVAGLLLWLAAARARGRLRDFAGALVPRLVRRGGHTARSVLGIAAVAACVVALARPAWGVFYEEVQDEGLEIVVLLDASRSMLAEDAAPNRLERARIAVDKLIDRVQQRGGHRLGLVAFAGVSVVRAPVTADLEYVRERLASTTPDDVPRGGTLIGDAVRRALELLAAQGEHDRVILLLTDGEDHESFPVEAARAAADAGVAIYAVGIGDASTGGRIPITDEFGHRTFLQHAGGDVVSRLDEETLRQMTDLTGGGYVPAGTRTIPLDRIYETAIATRRTGLFGSSRGRRRHERFQWAVGAALLLVVLSRFAARRPEAAL